MKRILILDMPYFMKVLQEVKYMNFFLAISVVDMSIFKLKIRRGRVKK